MMKAEYYYEQGIDYLESKDAYRSDDEDCNYDNLALVAQSYYGLWTEYIDFDNSLALAGIKEKLKAELDSMVKDYKRWT